MNLEHSASGWRAAMERFEALLSLPEPERQTTLERLRTESPELHRRVQALLQAAGQAPAAVAETIQPGAARLDQLAALREAKGLSQADLARAVGISPHYLNMIESGERQPDGAILRSLGRVLEIGDWEQSS